MMCGCLLLACTTWEKRKERQQPMRSSPRTTPSERIDDEKNIMLARNT